MELIQSNRELPKPCPPLGVLHPVALLQPGTKTTQERRALADLFVTVDRNAQQKLKKRALPEEFPADNQQAHEICTKPKAEGGLGMSFPTSAGQVVQAHRSPVCPRRSARRGLRQPLALAAAPGWPSCRAGVPAGASTLAAATQQRCSILMGLDCATCAPQARKTMARKSASAPSTGGKQ